MSIAFLQKYGEWIWRFGALALMCLILYLNQRYATKEELKETKNAFDGQFQQVVEKLDGINEKVTQLNLLTEIQRLRVTVLEDHEKRLRELEGTVLRLQPPARR